MDNLLVYKETKNPIQINPNDHDIKDTAKHLKSSLPAALKNLALGIVVVSISAVILYLVGDKINSVMSDSWIKKIILASIAGGMLGLFYFLVIHNFQAVLASLFKPNLKTPEKAVKTYFSSVKKDLYERAYNLLSDNAQELEMIKFPVETEMQKNMPDVYFHNLESFENFWSKIKFSWDLSYIQPKCKKKDERSAIVEVEITPTNNDTNLYGFKAEFALIKKDDYWFLCNGFIWPQTSSDFHKLP